MPDAALEATERQFRSLLEEAAGGSGVHLALYALPDVPRSEEARRHIRELYSDISELWTRELDGLIVTGTEPRKAELADEPYWGSLDAADRLGRRAYAFGRVVVPGGPCRGAASRRHSPPAPRRQAVWRIRVRAHLRAPAHGGCPAVAANAALAMERPSRRRAVGARLPGPHAISRSRGRHLRQATEQPVRVLSGSSRVRDGQPHARVPARHPTVPAAGARHVPGMPAGLFRRGSAGRHRAAPRARAGGSTRVAHRGISDGEIREHADQYLAAGRSRPVSELAALRLSAETARRSRQDSSELAPRSYSCPTEFVRSTGFAASPSSSSFSTTKAMSFPRSTCSACSPTGGWEWICSSCSPAS